MTNNISLFAGAGLPGLLQNNASAAAPAGANGLFDFLNLILSAQDGTVAPGDMTAKISALLQQQGQEGSLSALARILYKASPGLQERVPAGATPAEILKNLAALAGEAGGEKPVFRPALLRDLTAASMPGIVQQADAQNPPPLPAPAASDEAQALMANTRLAMPASDAMPEALRQEAQMPDLSRGGVMPGTPAALAREGGSGAVEMPEYLSLPAGTPVPASDAAMQDEIAGAPAAKPGAPPIALQDARTAQTALPRPAAQGADADLSEQLQILLPRMPQQGAGQEPAAILSRQTASHAAAPQPQQPVQADLQARPQPAPQPSSPAPLSFINEMAGGDAGFDAEGWQFREGGQLMFQPGAAVPDAGKGPAGAQGFAHYMQAAHAPATQMIGMRMVRNAMAKVESMMLQLEPADLGRLHIRMTFGEDGGMKAHLSAEKPETLAMLQRDAAHLQRVLHQAGFDMDDTSLSFDLHHGGRGDGGFSEANGNARGKAAAPHMNGMAEEPAANIVAAQVVQGYVTPRGVNIMV